MKIRGPCSAGYDDEESQLKTGVPSASTRQDAGRRSYVADALVVQFCVRARGARHIHYSFSFFFLLPMGEDPTHDQQSDRNSWAVVDRWEAVDALVPSVTILRFVAATLPVHLHTFTAATVAIHGAPQVRLY